MFNSRFGFEITLQSLTVNSVTFVDIKKLG